MAISVVAPNPDNIVIGKGQVWIKRATDPDYIRVGNVTEFEVTPELEELDHFDQQGGVKEIDKTVILSKKLTVRMVMEEWNPINLSIMLMGDAIVVANVATIDIMSQNVTRVALKYVGQNEVGPKWTFTYPAVDFKPSSSIQTLSEEWAPLEVTGTIAKSGGSFGSATATFVDVIPSNTGAGTADPVIMTDGTPAVGETLEVFPGIWTGSPATFSYQWKNATVAIPGATGKTYLVVAGDTGDSITCTVTATNGAGSANTTTAAVVIA